MKRGKVVNGLLLLWKKDSREEYKDYNHCVMWSIGKANSNGCDAMHNA